MELVRRLPSPLGKSREELLALLSREEYGYCLPNPTSYTVDVGASSVPNFCAGKAELLPLTFHLYWPSFDFSFPVSYVRPVKSAPSPCFLHLNFRSDIPDRYQPTEEIVDRGYAIFTLNYEDITRDNGDFQDGLCGLFFPEGKRTPDAPGKLMFWAFAASQILTYIQTLPEIRGDRVSVCGHSRLGKTALLAGAIDPRFYCAFSNDSGCSGASLARENTGETVEDITRVLPFWFCENYWKYAKREETLPFDQHFLLCLNAPHLVYVASAEEDSWACPKNEYRSCIAASPYFEALGLPGFIAPETFPQTGTFFHEGQIGYHIRPGKHYFSRQDWNFYMDFLARHP